MNPSRLLINILKYFWFWFQIRWDIRLFGQSVYSQNTYRSASGILSIQTDSFRIFSEFEQQNLVRRFITFHIFSVYVHIISAHFQYMNRFTPHILSIRLDSFPVLGECSQIILNNRNLIIFITAFKEILLQKSICVCNWTEDQQGLIDYLALAWQNNFFMRILIIQYTEGLSNSNISANSNFYWKII